MTKKDIHSLTLAERLKRLFMREKPHAEILQASEPAPHSANDMAFKAGAIVTFITPIGAYAGNHTENSLRERAEQQFLQMDSTRNTTIN